MNCIDRLLSASARTIGVPASEVLTAVSLEEFSARSNPIPAASPVELIAGAGGGVRIWRADLDSMLLPPLHLARTERFRQPWFAADPPSYRTTRQACIRMEGALVFPRSGLASVGDGKLFRNDLRRWVPEHRLTPGFLDLDQTSLRVRRAATRHRRRVGGPTFVLCHVWHTNYGHFLVDCLPTLLQWQELLARHRLGLLMPPLEAWHLRTLELLGIPTASIVRGDDGPVRCEDAVIPGLLTMVDEPAAGKASYTLPQPPSSVKETIRALVAGVGAAPASGRAPERIYVSRRGLGSWRRMRNEADVEGALERLGFTIVRPQELTFDEQVATFSRARVIVGPHGAGLTNAAFAPAGCLVVDICLENWASRWMLRLAQLFDHRYLPLACAEDSGSAGMVTFADARYGEKRSYAVPLEDLCDLLRESIRGLGTASG
jgi:hypothetical protein